MYNSMTEDVERVPRSIDETVVPPLNVCARPSALPNLRGQRGHGRLRKKCFSRGSAINKTQRFSPLPHSKRCPPLKCN
jgi:hypothetical protein